MPSYFAIISFQELKTTRMDNFLAAITDSDPYSIKMILDLFYSLQWRVNTTFAPYLRNKATYGTNETKIVSLPKTASKAQRNHLTSIMNSFIKGHEL